ncbi:aldehyde dehydrogenase family protein [Hyphococcus flavus]|uniref:Aldehyde dehydrogenase family protein n=1 Tax=Hyphococcus flavus TaxID=1866326 RepID=A0AAE9ZBJ0_9PROT|nr:aldehyde dehydrogenase family protein [Hyphococcus flavus]WDI30170.1 aldehyde dehydrogenase family protein [Hyphococcus flavus]
MSNVAEIFETMEYGPAPEESAYVRDWLKEKSGGFQHYINGEFISGDKSQKIIESRNPATGEKLASFPAAGETEVNAAVTAAKATFPKWSKLSGHERAKYLYTLARLVQKNSRFLSVLETLDNGKPIRETRDIDIPLVARHFYHHAGWAQLQETEFADYEPLGVVGQIIPWNFPLLMLAWKIAPAIAMGNTVVLKPAEYTSLTALYFAELCKEAQIPPGVINIVTGEGETGELIVKHQDIAKIAFTGSTEVGRIIRRQTAGSGKKLSLELGGKSPFIIFEDADLDGAVESLVDAIWFNQGQVCCAGSRLLVEESVAGKVTEKIKKRLSSFRIGDPLDKAIDMGAIVDPVQRDRIQTLVEQGEKEGGEVWSPKIDVPEIGCFYPPTLISNVSPSNVAVREEIFGPVLTSMSFRTLKEAIDLANNTRYGLAATIWSENVNRALEAASMVKTGVVWVNTTNGFDAACGFGGYRESGFGREGGREGIYEYVKLRKEWGGIEKPVPAVEIEEDSGVEGIDQTPKQFIGGKQKRPDWARTMPVAAHDGTYAGRVSFGNRKDIRDAVEAAFKAPGWGATTGHARAQILYFIAENFSKRADEFTKRLQQLTGATKTKARAEVDATVSRLFAYGAWADKYDGLAHSPPSRNVVLAMNEPIGIVATVCPDTVPLLSFVSMWAPAVAMGNRVVVVPSERYPLLATDFYQILETSDVPAGVINIVTGERATLVKTLAEHDQVEAIWHHGPADECKFVEEASADNLKRVWTNHGRARNWFDPRIGEGREFLSHACEVKNIWLPYGD